MMLTYFWYVFKVGPSKILGKVPHFLEKMSFQHIRVWAPNRKGIQITSQLRRLGQEGPPE